MREEYLRPLGIDSAYGADQWDEEEYGTPSGSSCELLGKGSAEDRVLGHFVVVESPWAGMYIYLQLNDQGLKPTVLRTYSVSIEEWALARNQWLPLPSWFRAIGSQVNRRIVGRSNNGRSKL